MKKELDNKKMWESLIQLLQNSPYPSLRLIGHGLHNALESATKDDEIVSIGPDSQRMISAEAKEALLENSSRYNKHCETCNVKINLCNPDVCEIIKCMKSAKPTIASTFKEEPELTDFEKCFQGMCHEDNQKFAKACCVSLMALARKQIASELEDYKSDASLDMMPDGWFVGVEDCINKIKRG